MGGSVDVADAVREEALVAMMPEAEFEVSATLVVELLRAQHPDLADLPLVAVGNGWDNALFRLGRDLVVRLPRREVADALMVEEQRWLPRLTTAIDVATSTPLRLGRPSPTYPWHWSVCRWIDGVNAALVPRAARSNAVVPLARFLGTFHRPAPDDAPVSPVGRGGPLAARDDVVRRRLSAMQGVPNTRLLQVWDRAIAAPGALGTRLWLHGDLHPANVVLRSDGSLAGVVDFGDLCSGDPATDLAVAWLMFDADGRRHFRAAAGAIGSIDAATWNRARGWAVSIGSALAASSDDAPDLRTAGLETLEEVLED